MNPLIALCTDFGLQDHYVAAMKGVILGIAPQARLVDLSHDVAPQAVDEAGYLLSCAAPFFPDGTVFIAVVDPGVGGPRRVLAVETERHRFVAPDNGLLAPIIADFGARRVISVTNRDFFLPEVSATFHGRDIFAPVGAHWAAGVDIMELGHEIGDPVTPSGAPVRVDADGRLGCRVMHVDRFGNLISTLRRAEFERLASPSAGAALIIEVGARRIAGLSFHYASAPPGSLVALWGSSERLEISVVEGSAAKTLGLEKGASITLLIPS